MHPDTPSHTTTSHYTTRLFRSGAPTRYGVSIARASALFRRRDSLSAMQPKGSGAFKKMKRRGKPFEQVELPVESEDGFKCEKCNGVL
jgi:hypothetical protein